MALKGTLKDFGIADILQLISHQTKSGELVLRTRGQQVTVWFVSGNIVGAEEAGRKRRDMLGSMMVRSNEITQAELDYSLEIQRRTDRRLGEVLLDTTNVSVDVLRDFAELQTTETLYKLFLWDSGQYAFSQQSDDTVVTTGVLISGEHILIEGFRQLDEWPIIRRQLTSYAQTFVRVGQLPFVDESERLPNEPLDFETSLFRKAEKSAAAERDIGSSERKVFALIAPGHDVQRIIDLARLGEFETCRAICNLLRSGLIAPSHGRDLRREPTAEATVGGIIRRQRTAWVGVFGIAFLTAGIVGLLVKGPGEAGRELIQVFSNAQSAQGYQDQRLLQVLSKNQILFITEAIGAYQTEYRIFPPDLDRLVEVGLLQERDLGFPWQNRYQYRAEETFFELVRPLE